MRDARVDLVQRRRREDRRPRLQQVHHRAAQLVGRRGEHVAEGVGNVQAEQVRVRVRDVLDDRVEEIDGRQLVFERRLVHGELHDEHDATSHEANTIAYGTDALLDRSNDLRSGGLVLVGDERQRVDDGLGVEREVGERELVLAHELGQVERRPNCGRRNSGSGRKRSHDPKRGLSRLTESSRIRRCGVFGTEHDGRDREAEGARVSERERREGEQPTSRGGGRPEERGGTGYENTSIEARGFLVWLRRHHSRTNIRLLPLSLARACGGGDIFVSLDRYDLSLGGDSRVERASE